MSKRLAVVLKVAVLLILLGGIGYFLLLLLTFLRAPAPFLIRSDGGVQVMDFVGLYEAAKLALSPERFSCYDPLVQHECLNRVIAPEHSPAPWFVTYPPFAFPLFAPLGLLSLPAAYLLWNVVSSALAIWLLNGILRDFGTVTSRLDRAIILAGLLFCQPAIFCLRLGQTSWWLLICFCLFFRGLAGRAAGEGSDSSRALKMDLLSGIAAAFSTLKPQYFAYFVVPLLTLRRKRALIIAAVTELVLLLLAAATIGPKNVLNYPRWLAFLETSKVAEANIAAKAMVNFRGLITGLLPAPAVVVISVVALLGMILALWLVWSKVRCGLDIRWAMAVTLLVASVVTPHLHSHDLVLIGLAAAVTLPSLSITAVVRIPNAYYRYWSLLVLYFPLLSWLFYMFRFGEACPWFCLFNLVLLTLGLLIVFTVDSQSLITIRQNMSEPEQAEK